MGRRSRNKGRPSNRDDGAFNEDFLLHVLPGTASIESVSSETVLQQLWAGYGSVRSLTVRRTLEDGGGVEEAIDLIVKRVRPPSDDGASVSHARKMRSYAVEAEFYTKYAPRLKSSGAPCAIPAAYQVIAEEDPPLFTFLFSDLRTEFPVPDPFRIDRARTEAALRWLAGFHAAFWEDDSALPSCGQDGGSFSLWECGGYWHLDTRLDELDCMDRMEWGRLRAGAFAIDRKMRASAPAFTTLCHGDFKSANLLFRSDGSECAAVDFQYVGGGHGMKDVVMLLVSSADPGLVAYDAKDSGKVKELIRYYHGALLETLCSAGRVPEDRIAAYTIDVALGHYELCLLDYVRFMAGWGFWGENCRYAQDLCQRIMKDMEANGADLRTEHGWEIALGKRYHA